MASDPALLVLMLGLGLTEFSMAPAAIPRARHILRHVAVDHAKGLAREIVAVTPAEARAILDAVVRKAEETPLVTKE
jgi:phosphoenolpyruvate-protein kinase (PTS system EI component)